MPSKKIKYASIMPRFMAFVIDLFLIYLAIFLLLRLANIDISSELAELLVIIVNMIYTVSMTASKSQGTLGKILFKIIVVDEKMKGLSLSHSFGRYLAYYFSYITLGIGFFMIGLTKKHMGLHDKIANTYVIYKHN